MHAENDCHLPSSLNNPPSMKLEQPSSSIPPTSNLWHVAFRLTSKCKSKPLTESFRNEGEIYKTPKLLQKHLNTLNVSTHCSILTHLWSVLNSVLYCTVWCHLWIHGLYSGISSYLPLVSPWHKCVSTQQGPENDKTKHILRKTWTWGCMQSSG